MSGRSTLSVLQYLHRLAREEKANTRSDRECLERFVAQHDEDAFAVLMRRHGPMVLGVCRRVLHHRQDAEDAFQATFLVLARKASSVRWKRSIAPWLHQVAYRLASKARVEAARRREHERQTTVEAFAPATDPSWREVCAVLDEELQSLAEKYRAPLVLCYLEGQTRDEAAERLRWSLGTLKRRLQQGRELLRLRLTRRGVTLPMVLLSAGLTGNEAGAALSLLAARSLAQAATAFASGGAISGPPLQAVPLAEGMLHMMSTKVVKVLAVLVLTLSAVAGAGLWTCRMLVAQRPQEQRMSSPDTARDLGPRQAVKDEPRPRTDRHGDPLPPHAIARLGTLRFRGVRGCLAFSPDGKRLATATGTFGERIAIWDTTTGREVRHIAGSASLTSLTFSSDGKRLACSPSSNECRVHDVDTGKELFTVPGYYGAFSADGKVLVTADLGRDARVRTWDAGTGKSLPMGYPCFALDLVLAADGRTAALIDRADPTAVNIVDLAKEKVIRSIPLGPAGRYLLALAADGKTLAAVNGAPDGVGVWLWDLSSGEEIGSWKTRYNSRPVFSPDGKRLAWTGWPAEGGFAQLWTAERGSPQPRAIGEPVYTIHAPCFSPDGKVLAAVTGGGAVVLLEVVSGKEVVSFDASTLPILDAVFSADGQQIVSRLDNNLRADNDLFVWRTQSGKLLRRSCVLPAGHKFMAPLLSGGHLLTEEPAAYPKPGRCCLRDMRTGAEVMRFDGQPDVIVAPGGRYVGVRGRRFSEVQVLDVRARRCLYRVPGIPDATLGMKLSMDGDVLIWGRRLAAECEVHVHRRTADKTIVLRDLPKDDQLERSLTDRSCLSPDGGWLVLATREGRLRRWDLTTGAEVPTLAEAFRITWDLCWSPDSRLVAAYGSASTGGERKFDDAFRGVRVWDVRTSTRLAHLTMANRYGGMLLRFTHDGRMLVTTDQQGSIHLWEVTTGKERATLKGHLAYNMGIGALAVSADDRMLVSGGYDSQGFVWDLTGRMPDGQWRSVRHPPDKLRTAWEALVSDDAKAAYAAMWELVADPEGSTTFLRQRLRPVPRPKPGQVEQLIAALDADKFVERQRATRELETLGEVAAAELRQTLKGKPTLEARRRVEALLARLEHVPAGEKLRTLRAIEALEHIGTSEARDALRGLAEGAPGARLTLEAQAARERLKNVEP